jgi:hypothetical protein
MRNDALSLKNVLDEVARDRERGEPVDPASLGISEQGYTEAPLSRFRPTAVERAAQAQRERENPPPPLTSEEHEAALRENHADLEAAGLRVPSALSPEPELHEVPVTPEPQTTKRGLLARLLKRGNT